MMNNTNTELERMDFLMRYTTMMLEGIKPSDLTNEQMLDLLYQQYMKTIALLEIREKKVYINGSFLEESWANINNDLRFLNSEVSGRDNFGPYIIGYNEYFVLSDNRDYGYDSRDFGSVNFSFINGKVINR